ncbi:MAG: tyrosine-type recombinase/integrase [Bryobacteraceae bacterium]|jgi:integrase
MRGQRGSVVQKGNSYFIKYRGSDGKQKMSGSRPGHGFKTYEEAQARLHEVLNDINKGGYVEQKKISFQVFAEAWIKERLSIRGSTASAYGSIIRQHLIPGLGALPVHEIRLDHVQALISELAKSVSVKTLHNSMTLLRVMLLGKKGASAIKRGYIRYDPTKGVELPSRVHANIQPPTPAQVWKLINTAQALAATSKSAQVAHSAIFLDAFTGLRRGEILALRYSDIDWFAREIVVNRSVSKVNADDGVHKWAWSLGPTKSKRSRRVGIGEKALRVLAELKQAAADNEGFVFTPEAAGLAVSPYTFIDPDYFDASIYGPIVSGAGLAGIRFHDLRHFFASMLIAQGESAKYVCDQMGHSSIQVTFDTYGHLFPQAKQEASSKLEKVMFAMRKEPSVENLVEKSPKPPPAKHDGRRAS